MAMAGVWEATIATAIRDAQWIAGDGINMPDAFLSLSGNVEKHYGDTFFQSGRGYYFFELKGSSKSINTEWIRTYNYVAPGSNVVLRLPRVKAAHEFAVDLAVRGVHGDAKDREMLIHSLRGHHFVYWSDHSVHPSDCLSGLVMSPYILATIDGLVQRKSPVRGASHNVYGDYAFELAKDIRKIATLSHSGPIPLPDLNLEFGLEVPFSAVYLQTASINVANAGKATDEALGMKAEEAANYANAISQGRDPDERLNGVMWGVNGFYRAVSRLSDLTTLSSSPAPRASSRAAPQSLRDLRARLAQGKSPASIHRPSPPRPRG